MISQNEVTGKMKGLGWIRAVIEILMIVPWVFAGASFIEETKLFPFFPVALFLLFPTGIAGLSILFLSRPRGRGWASGFEEHLATAILATTNTVIGLFGWMLLFVVVA